MIEKSQFMQVNLCIMKSLHFSIIIIVIVLLFSVTFSFASALVVGGPVFFMKSNSTGYVYTNLDFRMLNNTRWASPGIFLGLNESPIPIPADSKKISIFAEENNATGLLVYAITAKNDTKGVYLFSLAACGDAHPFAVDMNESEVDPAFLYKYSNDEASCPSGYSPPFKIIGYSNMILKRVFLYSDNRSQFEPPLHVIFYSSNAITPINLSLATTVNYSNPSQINPSLDTTVPEFQTMMIMIGGIIGTIVVGISIFVMRKKKL